VIPYSYNGNSQIAQTSGEVIDQAKVIHGTKSIPLGGCPHGTL